jgi:hypothetical protein
VSDDGSPALFSNIGDQITIAAPGVRIISTEIGGGYSQRCGTSFAAPIVTLTVGLLRAYDPLLSALEIKKRLLAASDFDRKLDRGDDGMSKVRLASVLNIKKTLNFTRDIVQTKDGESRCGYLRTDGTNLLVKVPNLLPQPIPWKDVEKITFGVDDDGNDRILINLGYHQKQPYYRCDVTTRPFCEIRGKVSLTDSKSNAQLTQIDLDRADPSGAADSGNGTGLHRFALDSVGDIVFKLRDVSDPNPAARGCQGEQ